MTTNNSTAVTVSADFKEKITTRVRDMFMDLFPPEQLDQMVSNEIKAFFEVSKNHFTITRHEESRLYSSNAIVYNYGVKATPFRLLVWGEVSNLVSAKIKALMDTDKFKAEVQTAISDKGYMEAEGVLGEYWEKKLEENVMAIAKEMFRGTFTQAVEAAKMTVYSELTNHVNNQHGGNF